MIDNAAAAHIGYVIDQLPLATAFFNKQRKLVFASSKWITEFAFDRHDIIGKSLFQLFGRQGKAWDDAVRQSLSGNHVPALTRRHFNDTKDEQRL